MNIPQTQPGTLDASRMVCKECGHTVDVPPLAHKQRALCPHCQHVLVSHHLHSEQRMLAFGLAGLVLLVLAIPFDFILFSNRGQENTIHVLSGVTILLEQGNPLLALVLFLAIVLLPAAILASLVVLLWPRKRPLPERASSLLVRVVERLLPWSMAEIFVVGVLVSLIKISELAEVHLGFSFYAYVGFTLCGTLTVIHLDILRLRQRLAIPQVTTTINRSHSVQTTWALLLTALFLYIPANTLPIMHTRVLGQDEPSTILGGVVTLWKMGSYPIALVIFVASVLVPIAKLIVLAWLNYTVQNGSTGWQRERILGYRITEFIGRWSMVDVFVVALLVSLVQLGNSMSVLPGPAALAFCGVVLFTMLAARSFDQRLIFKGHSHHA
ncbi:paraquat-inducible protein A [Aestuariibacter halophilus]|uniref:Paraquat-inducible protein A n=1 Tax=Fluctibacter halophilus TaxID=226011 RepID=A0ABS8G6G5_9ALTE|nr:paraquat-inducible protein A [Aestuariibacter halophilus]MCC2616084.1 paraquat-inducible protein A [Aestuariibacter halophilus]